MRKIQTQGVHHITIIGADRQTSIDFWEGVLGMPFIFDQPNLDDPNRPCPGLFTRPAPASELALADISPAGTFSSRCPSSLGTCSSGT